MEEALLSLAHDTDLIQYYKSDLTTSYHPLLNQSPGDPGTQGPRDPGPRDHIMSPTRVATTQTLIAIACQLQPL